MPDIYDMPVNGDTNIPNCLTSSLAVTSEFPLKGTENQRKQVALENEGNLPSNDIKSDLTVIDKNALLV